MNDHICATCMFWVQSTPATTCDYRPPQFGYCLSPHVVRGYSLADNERQGDMAILVENDVGWGFYSGAYFGCIHWSGRQ